MKLLFAFPLLILQFQYPVLKTTGQQVFDFVPDNWKILQIAKGDLNGDQLEDFAFVLEYDDGTDWHPDRFPMGWPRILGIAFRSIENDAFMLEGQNNEIILTTETGGTYGDPFAGIRIDGKGVLNIDFYGGSAWRWGINRKYRYQSDAFYLIGETHQKTHAPTPGYLEEESINYLTCRQKNVSNLNGKYEETWKDIECESLKPLNLHLNGQ